MKQDYSGGGVVPIPSGEGERRAQRGYVPQYSLAAEVIYAALASGRLRWIGVADRGAASFDDLVLGLTDGISAYQVKTSRDPKPFGLKILLLGAEDLLGRMMEARRTLQGSFADQSIETVFICNDYPRADDDLCGSGRRVSSAAYLRAHEVHRLSWQLNDWRNSEYWPFVASIQERSGLADGPFEAAWRNTRFMAGAQRGPLGIRTPTAGDERRLGEISALLPRLVADRSDKDRWSFSELLERLGWRDPFGLRHNHSFPVDALYESNAPTQERLHQVLSAKVSGYIALIGPPGSGKSTLLASGLLPAPRANVARYLAFLPGLGQGLGRAEAIDFLNDVVKQLKQQGLGSAIIPGTELTELREQLESLLLEAGVRFSRDGTRTIIVVDGLDHVPREERPERSFLAELPAPQAVPQGVVFVLGTQRLDLPNLPPSVIDQAQEEGRFIPIAPLAREAVSRLADLAGLPADVDRGEVFSRSEGHPLSTRYIIGALLNAQTAEARKDWLVNGPAYDGDIDVFYKRAWRDVAGNLDALRGMAYLALAEAPIQPTSLDLVIGSAATDAMWAAVKHLLLRNRKGAWVTFHNSFRLFLMQQTALRHDLPNEEQIRSRYLELAELCRAAEEGDPHRWMELRYLARALKDEDVANLASPRLFRSQFIQGRDPAEIRWDIGLGLRAAKRLHRPALVLDLIFASHEIGMRMEALSDDVFRALIDVGDLEAAEGLLRSVGVSLTDGIGFELVDAYLAGGEIAEARKLFEKLEPIDELLGSKPIGRMRESGALEEWATRALAFRDRTQILASLARLRWDDQFEGDAVVVDYRVKLKLLAARGQLERNPGLSPGELAQSLEIGTEELAIVRYFAALVAFDVGSSSVALGLLEASASDKDCLSSTSRRQLARIAIALGRYDLARLFLDGVLAPSIGDRQIYDSKDIKDIAHEVILHSCLASRAGMAFASGTPPASPLVAACQSKLRILGELLADGFEGRRHRSEILQEIGKTLDFLQRADGEGPYDSERWRVNSSMAAAISAMAEIASLFGEPTFSNFIELADSALASGGRLSRPSVRRAYARAVFRHDHDAVKAEGRLAYSPVRDGTPGQMFSEAALTASTLASFGLYENGRHILMSAHETGLGYSRPAGKDAQYLLWSDFLVRANAEDPAGRPRRIKFLGKLLSGMAETEGSTAASRVVPVLIEEAARAGAGFAGSAIDLAEKYNLSSWSEIVCSLILGVIRSEPRLSEAATVMFGRIALPFSATVEDDFLVEVIRLVPSERLEAVVRRLVGYLETDAPTEARILALETVIATAANRGLDYGSDALKRWRVELPPPKSGSSPEDPFFNLRTLGEIEALLSDTRESVSSHSAARAFVNVAPGNRYDSAKALFDAAPEIHKDERCIELMARLAIENKDGHFAEEMVSRLKRIAEEEGSWSGGYRSKAKQRYFQLRVALGDRSASRSAFDAFVNDLAGHREHLDYLLPELGNLLELTSPGQPWADAWERLEAYLTQFREHINGGSFDVVQTLSQPPEFLVADLLLRAIESTSSPLTQMARTAAIELSEFEGGLNVVCLLLPLLWTQGGYSALEAAQIIWECRSQGAVQETARRLLPDMANCDDAAVRRIAMKISNGWDLHLAPVSGTLPAIYALTLPKTPGLENFDPPSGFSETSSGLYSDEPLSWTWALKRPLEMVSSSAGLQVANLRMRAAQLMSQMGGANSFGPSAVEAQLAKLRRFQLHTPFRKLPVAAAFQAMRCVIGELDRAGTINLDLVFKALIESGAFSPIVRTTPPWARPIGVRAVVVPEIFGSGNSEDWLASVGEDATRPRVEGLVVLAATAIHERRFRSESRRVEQYFGPGEGPSLSSLVLQLRQLPTVIPADRVEVFTRNSSLGGVVHPWPIPAGSIDEYTVMLCPITAIEMGWRQDPNDAFRYMDSLGETVAFTMFWRDGGIYSRESDTDIRRSGCMLLVSRNSVSSVKRHFAKEYVSRAWRSVKKDGEPSVIERNGYRIETPPE